MTPSEADILRVLAQTRNGIIHGNLHARPSKGDVDFLARVLERLLAESVGTMIRYPRMAEPRQGMTRSPDLCLKHAMGPVTSFVGRHVRDLPEAGPS